MHGNDLLRHRRRYGFGRSQTEVARTLGLARGDGGPMDRDLSEEGMGRVEGEEEVAGSGDLQ